MILYWSAIVLTIIALLGLILSVRTALHKLVIFIWCIPVLPAFGQVIQWHIPMSFTYVIFQIIFGLILATILVMSTKNLKCPRYFKTMLVLWLVGNILSVICSANSYESSVFFVIAIIFPIALYFSVINLITVEQDLAKVIEAFLVAGLFHVIISFLVILSFANERGLEHIHDIVLISGCYIGNGFIASFIMIFSFFLFFNEYDLKPWLKLSVYIVSILFLVEAVVTSSRTALVLIPAIILIYIFSFKTSSTRKVVFTAGLLTLIAIFLLINPGNTRDLAQARLVGYNQELTIHNMWKKASNNQRIDIWQNTLHMVTNYSVIGGVGLGQMKEVDSRYTFGDAHSLWLNIFAQQGLLSIVSFIALLVVFFANNIKWRLRKIDLNNTLLACFWAMLSFIVYGSITGANLISQGGYNGAIVSYYIFLVFGIQDSLIKLRISGKEELL